MLWAHKFIERNNLAWDSPWLPDNSRTPPGDPKRAIVRYPSLSVPCCTEGSTRCSSWLTKTSERERQRATSRCPHLPMSSTHPAGTLLPIIRNDNNHLPSRFVPAIVKGSNFSIHPRAQRHLSARSRSRSVQIADRYPPSSQIGPNFSHLPPVVAVFLLCAKGKPFHRLIFAPCDIWGTVYKPTHATRLRLGKEGLGGHAKEKGLLNYFLSPTVRTVPYCGVNFLTKVLHFLPS